MTQDKAKPEKLSAWLEDNRAKQIWSVFVDRIGSLRAYDVNGRLLLILHYGRGEHCGWDVFLPVESLKADATLAAMSAACGLGESEGDAATIVSQLYKASEATSSAVDHLRAGFALATPLEVITLSGLNERAVELNDDLANFHDAIGDTAASKPGAESEGTP